jgi:hypothetical protein
MIILDTDASLSARKNATMFVMHLMGDLHQPLHLVNYEVGGNNIKPICFGHPYPECASSLNLHAVWDARIIHKLRKLRVTLTEDQERGAAKLWAEELHASKPSPRHSSASGEKEEDWIGVDIDTKVRGMLAKVARGEGDERSTIEDELHLAAVRSNSLACSSALARGKTWLLKHDLGKEYYDENWPIVESQIKLAGSRLSGVMNFLASRIEAKKASSERVGEGEL